LLRIRRAAQAPISRSAKLLRKARRGFDESKSTSLKIINLAGLFQLPR